MKSSLRMLAPWLAALLFWGLRSEARALSPVSSQCSGAEYRRLDFWVGDWDAYDAGNDKPVARTRVEVILGGCGLREIYEQNDGLVGESFTTYDASRRSGIRPGLRTGEGCARSRGDFRTTP